MPSARWSTRPWPSSLGIVSSTCGSSATRCKRRSAASHWNISTSAKSSLAWNAPRKASTQGDYEFATEVLGELEAEGQLDQQIGLLRGRVDQAVRQTRIQQCWRMPGVSSKPPNIL